MSTFPFKEESLHDIPSTCGVYRFSNSDDTIIYVGKAINLRNRLRSYFKHDTTVQKIKLIQAKTKKITITLTRTEHEALLLENALIKKHMPTYNVLLKDDKTYPYIAISNHDFPRIHVLRSRTKKEYLYGPYTNKLAIRVTLDHIQRLFKIRTCRDFYFQNRSKPCLQYQLKRCSAPCVNFISKDQYSKNIKSVKQLLTGKNKQLTQKLTSGMNEASKRLDYELAASYRDKIKMINHIQTQHYSNIDKMVDIFGIANNQQWICIYHMSYLDGTIQEGKPYFYQYDPYLSYSEVLSYFLLQFYEKVSLKSYKKHFCLLPENCHLGEGVLELIQKEHNTKLNPILKGRKNFNDLLTLSVENAKMSLFNHNLETESFDQLLALFNLSDQISDFKIECYDISHQYGEHTSGSCVVFDEFGPVKSEYRRDKLELKTASDDYEAMSQLIERRFSKKSELPTLMIIDGGENQIKAVTKSLDGLQRVNYCVVGISKGTTRKVGLEKFMMYQEGGIQSFEPDLTIKRSLYWIRDEAHRFAITHSRKMLQKNTLISKLEYIPGVGPNIKKKLLQHFGGWKEISEATVEQFTVVPLVGQSLAKKIYAYLHDVDLNK